MEIKNLKKAAKRIKQAVEKGEKILLYGDADLDGVCATIILEETIKSLGGKVTAVYFPDRETEGYGISKRGLEFLKPFSPGLLISLDLGISSFEELELAEKLGFETIVIDHHRVLEKLPKAKIIVDPFQKGDKYPFKKFSTTGLVYKLAEAIFESDFPEVLKRNFLELTALATLADTMPREGENEIFIAEGLSSIENSWRPGLAGLFKINFFNKNSSLEQKVFRIISVLNVRDVENNLPASYRLLTASSKKEIEELIEKLLEKAKVKREKLNQILEEIEKRIGEEKIIFEGSEEWDFSLISPLASILSQKFKRPTFIFKKMKEESQGTVRTPEGVDSLALMKKCKDILISFGGHPQASGFRIKNENLEKFKNCLISNLKK
jgi:single-stranded-DNA-specific exonuclease